VESSLPPSFTGSFDWNAILKRTVFGAQDDSSRNMNITVQIPSALRRHTGGAAKVSCSATNLDELLSDLDTKFPDLKPHLRDESGQIRRFLYVYVNEEDIRFLGGASYSFKEGDEVLLVPSIAGGCSEERLIYTITTSSMPYWDRLASLTQKLETPSQTSAASLTLFGKDGKVVWSAP
jgi:molybdopterin converting factor small subunit